MDIVERLKTGACCEGRDCGRAKGDQDGMCAFAKMRKDAAAEIERLRTALDNARMLLMEIDGRSEVAIAIATIDEALRATGE
jgi:hypothetical protein